VETSAPTTAIPIADSPRRSRVYQGWINLIMAAVAMTATLPGRTHGLGLITKGLCTDSTMDVDEQSFSVMNFWAVLLGSLLCFPVGKLIDRFGVRGVLVGVAAALGASVIGMSVVTGVILLFVTLTLVRGLGQGALSVVSMAMIGKWFTRRLPMAMAIFTVLLSFGFVAANFAVGMPVEWLGWRTAWLGVGLFLLGVLAPPLGALLVRSTPEAMGHAVEWVDDLALRRASIGTSLALALKSPLFWAFTTATSFFNLTWSAITLFNESILNERGFDKQTFLLVMGVLVISGLPANLICGWLAQRWPMGRLLAFGMVLLAGSLAFFPQLAATWHTILYAATLGAAGGIVTVIFFAVYGQAFGREHLGAIQGTAQIVTIFASALGPVLLQWTKQELGSYTPFFIGSAAIAVSLGVVVWIVPARPVRNG
jgi:MFS family permease